MITTLQNNLWESLKLLEKKSFVGKDLGKRIEKRLNEGKLTREENTADHACAFFVPWHVSSDMVFIGHHIKADEWIPPGGHIELGESPVQAVVREFQEELGEQIDENIVDLIGVSMVDIEPKKGKSCRRHWDFWHRVRVDRLTEYEYDRREFYEASWRQRKEVVNMFAKTRPTYAEILSQLEKV